MNSDADVVQKPLNRCPSIRESSGEDRESAIRLSLICETVIIGFRTVLSTVRTIVQGSPGINALGLGMRG